MLFNQEIFGNHLHQYGLTLMRPTRSQLNSVNCVKKDEIWKDQGYQNGVGYDLSYPNKVFDSFFILFL